jgi:chromosome segregation protein
VYLSQLEILGFKSFPEKTVLEFNGDITAVVGPNGCGKTNILDSIRWVLGEQRSSALRSSRMEEVIFNGTAQMKPLGLAEVNLTIKNNRGVLPVEYDEVVITRRLYRSGESEYLLNKSQCRLKDIMELFYDTGMGPHAYSVIQQGMIDAILSDKTEDRRSLFEEAAGVTKYKHRKKEAIAKLEATEADLTRLGDIISEIEKQVSQLRRQAARARQYSRQKDEIKNLEVILTASLLFESQGKHQGLERQKGELQVQIEGLNAEFEKREMSLQESRLKMADLDHEASLHRQKHAELSSKASEIESEIKLNKHLSETANADIENSKNEIGALNDRIASIQKGIEENDSHLATLETQRQMNRIETDSIEEHLTELAKELSPAEAALNDRRTQNTNVAEKISALKAEIASLSELKNNLEKKLNGIRVEAEGIDESRNKDQDGFSILEKKRLETIESIQKLKKEKETTEAEISRVENLLSQKRDVISKKKAELSGLKARQELLGQLIDSGEGYSVGAKSLLSWADRPVGMMSPIAEVLEVPEKYRVAVTAALGEFGEVIPVKNHADAEAAIDYLKSTGGRASLLVLDKIDSIHFGKPNPEHVPALIGYLDDIVSAPDEYRPAISMLLSRVALFESKGAAINASRDWDYYTKVDLEGLVIHPSGIISGGKTVPNVVGRRQDLNEITKAINEISDDINRIEADFNVNLQFQTKLRDQLINIQNAEQMLEDEQRKIEAQLSQLKFDFKERETKYVAAIGQARNISNEIDYYHQKIAGLQEDLGSLDMQSKEGTDGLNDLLTKYNSLRNSVGDLEGKLTESRIKIIELDGLEAKLKSDIEHGKELCFQAQKMIASNEATIERSQKIVKTSISQNEDLETKLYDCFAERREVQEKFHAAEDTITESKSESDKIADELAVSRKEKEHLTSILHALEIEFLELESSRKSILERLKLEFNISSVEPAPLPEGKNAESLRQQIDETRSRLQKMDPVNPMAGEDYEREKDRLDFLLRQRDDLLKAEISLKEAIGRINTTAEERFKGTFVKIQDNFRDVFTTLFEGGEAHVELEEPSNPLESAIKIMARPGGKRLLAVTQLSGGERALTAISLLFSIYLVKPSPFCILDEVDAPLDDANLMRFIKLIKKFSSNTQFIIITHNKMTMEASSVLYGVTMETPGVSKVVSVKFDGNGNGNGNGNGLGQAEINN